MKEIIIFEDAMCCSTGICGPEPDKTLIKFNEDIKRIQDNNSDCKITRANMSSNLNLFLENKEIFKLVKENGTKLLPITTLDGKVVMKEKYPLEEDFKKILED